MHVQPSSRARCLIFGQTIHLLPFYMCVNSEWSDKTAQMRRLAWAVAGCLCDKYHNLMSWLIWATTRQNQQSGCASSEDWDQPGHPPSLISVGIRPVWSESSLATWRKLGSLATHWAHSEDSDQTGRMPGLIWVFTGRTVILLVLSCCGSFMLFLSFFCLFQHFCF